MLAYGRGMWAVSQELVIFGLRDREAKKEALPESLPAFEATAAQTSEVDNLVFFRQTISF